MLVVFRLKYVGVLFMEFVIYKNLYIIKYLFGGF